MPRSATIIAEVAFVHGVDRLDAEAGRDHPVVRGRRAAAQHVTERGHARFEPGALLDLVGEALTDAAEPHVAEVVDLARLQLHRALLRRRAFGRDDDREVRAALMAMREPVADLVDVERLLGNRG